MEKTARLSSDAQPRKRRRLSEQTSEDASSKVATAKRKLNKSASKPQAQKPSKSQDSVPTVKVSGRAPEISKSSKRAEVDMVEQSDSQTKAPQGHNDPLPPVKGLDSSDPSIRRKTFNTIIKHLQSRSPEHVLTETECLQLWRGFYVNLYMHDSKNALSVQKLITELAETFSIVAAKDDESIDGNESTSESTWLLPWHTAFWTTLVREWRGIDQWRINKFLSLVRHVTRELFVVIFSKSLGSDATAPATAQARKILDSQTHVLKTTGPFNPSDRKIADGLRLHLCDIWVDELIVARERVLTDNDIEAISEDVTASGLLQTLKEPLHALANGSSLVQKNVRDKAKEALQEFEERILDAGSAQ